MILFAVGAVLWNARFIGIDAVTRAHPGCSPYIVWMIAGIAVRFCDSRIVWGSSVGRQFA